MSEQDSKQRDIREWTQEEGNALVKGKGKGKGKDKGKHVNSEDKNKGKPKADQEK